MTKEIVEEIEKKIQMEQMFVLSLTHGSVLFCYNAVNFKNCVGCKLNTHPKSCSDYRTEYIKSHPEYLL